MATNISLNMYFYLHFVLASNRFHVCSPYTQNVCIIYRDRSDTFRYWSYLYPNDTEMIRTQNRHFFSPSAGTTSIATRRLSSRWILHMMFSHGRGRRCFQVNSTSESSRIENGDAIQGSMSQ
ncbi:unnamed protein product [Albugo candida]|uniref:Secreted protein n=1 Tax=Albugo candida TaxID=65357 RepID=A0A024FVK4_9STRA|nr:unnamed protein product [Albugo candida]|eukprot:CCI10694.1 unnamed protein product [Albugo candida]